MEYYIEVVRRFRVCIEADNEYEAQSIAFEHAEAMKNGIADDEDAIILAIDGKEVKR